MPVRFIALAAFVAAGWLGTGSAARAIPGSPAARGGFRTILGVGLGLGLLSVTHFMVLICGAKSPVPLLAAGLGEVLLLIAASRIHRGHRGRPPAIGDNAPTRSRLTAMLAVTMVGLSILAAALVAGRLLLHPYGQWDAWAIWNMHARFLVAGPDAAHTLYAPDVGLGHIDYPLLLPALVSFGWNLVGKTSTIVPALLAVLFAGETVALLGVGLSLARDRNLGLLGGLVLVGTVPFLATASWEYADVPLAFNLAACGFLLCLAGDADNVACLVLAGAFAGLAAWTKNEGLLGVVAAAAAVAAGTLASWRTRLGTVLHFLAGAVPFLAVIGYFKFAFAPPNDILGAQVVSEMVHKLLDPARYVAIGAAAVRYLARFPILGLVGFVLIVGVPKARLTAAPARTLFTMITVIGAGYAAVYLITPWDLAMHIETSMDRLVVQLWPLVLLLVFWTVNGGVASSRPVPSAGEVRT